MERLRCYLLLVCHLLLVLLGPYLDPLSYSDPPSVAVISFCGEVEEEDEGGRRREKGEEEGDWELGGGGGGGEREDTHINTHTPVEDIQTNGDFVFVCVFLCILYILL